MFYNLLIGAVGVVMLSQPDNSDVQKALGGGLIAVSLSRAIGGLQDVA